MTVTTHRLILEAVVAVTKEQRVFTLHYSLAEFYFRENIVGSDSWGAKCSGGAYRRITWRHRGRIASQQDTHEGKDITAQYSITSSMPAGEQAGIADARCSDASVLN